MRFDPTYIRSLNAHGIRGSILHITDTHICDEMSINEKGWLRDKIKSECGERRVDLLAVTGDIIHARGAEAASLEKTIVEQKMFFYL